jgi:hypothetical protein
MFNPKEGKYFVPGGQSGIAVLAEIVTETGLGVYTFKTYQGEGPTGNANVCTEVNLAVGIDVGTVVVCFEAEGDYYFAVPSTGGTATLATIATEVGVGVYTWTELYGGSGSGSATEMNLSTGILVGTNVVIHEGEDGENYFFFPIEACG